MIFFNLFNNVETLTGELSLVNRLSFRISFALRHLGLFGSAPVRIKSIKKKVNQSIWFLCFYSNTIK